jgi:hypothetical protein
MILVFYKLERQSSLALLLHRAEGELRLHPGKLATSSL